MKKIHLALLATLVAFNTEPNWKTDENGALVLSEGNPVYIDTTGAEKVVQISTISNLNREAKTQREGREAAELKLKGFEGLDPKASREALEKLSKIDQKLLIDSGEVDRVREGVKTEFTAQIAERDKTIATLTAEKHDMMIDRVFADSAFIRENVAMPIEFFKNYFRQNFKITDGKIQAFDPSGNLVMSKRNVGELATPEEALMILTEIHPQKNSILKAGVGSGGSGGSGGGGSGFKRTISIAELQKLSPAEQEAYALKAEKGEITIV